ncbi:protein related to COX8-cytochrome-c oxidase chain VIII [Pyrrhoderma noxium]|uniref:Cytochrome c oxidase subunit 8, mitochondrial n=1 Tax=Pyrrhoderma noxium TaxID=2282107 RepID=A0A286UMI8_9AGAM|nr:protein related to COX8-cytochrome-c oxidase chain VIII [Pyrrhoderma noxium]
MSILARSALRARAPAALRSTGIQRRALHVENTASNSVPFKADQSNKRLFGASLAVYLLTGALLPVAASVYQLKKSS